MKRLAAATFLLLALISFACADDGVVDAVVIVNPTEFTANVDVTGDRRDGWLGLATVEAGSDTTLRKVLDQGDGWVFRFSYSGYEEEVRLTRDELEAARWRVTVPESFESALRREGVPPPP